MPSFRTGSYRLDRNSGRGTQGEEGENGNDLKARLADHRKRGSSLPANCSSVSVRLLPPSLNQQSAADPDVIERRKAIPTDVIETDYLVQPISSEDSYLPEGKSDDTGKESQEESISCETPLTEPTSDLHADVCSALRKAFLDGLGQRVISRRGRNDGGSSYDLLLNADLLDRVSLDVARMSEREPSGLSGCRLRTRVERQHSADMDLGCVRVDQDAEETFEIVLSLKECRKTFDEKRHPGLIRNVASLLSNVFGHPTLRGRGVQPVEVYVSDAYQLEKIRFLKCSDATTTCAANAVGLCSA